MSITLRTDDNVKEEFISTTELLTLRNENSLLHSMNADCILAIENNKATIIELQSQLAASLAYIAVLSHNDTTHPRLMTDGGEARQTWRKAMGMENKP